MATTPANGTKPAPANTHGRRSGMSPRLIRWTFWTLLVTWLLLAGLDYAGDLLARGFIRGEQWGRGRLIHALDNLDSPKLIHGLENPDSLILPSTIRSWRASSYAPYLESTGWSIEAANQRHLAHLLAWSISATWLLLAMRSCAYRGSGRAIMASRWLGLGCYLGIGLQVLAMMVALAAKELLAAAQQADLRMMAFHDALLVIIEGTERYGYFDKTIWKDWSGMSVLFPLFLLVHFILLCEVLRRWRQLPPRQKVAPSEPPPGAPRAEAWGRDDELRQAR